MPAPYNSSSLRASSCCVRYDLHPLFRTNGISAFFAALSLSSGSSIKISILAVLNLSDFILKKDIHPFLQV